MFVNIIILPVISLSSIINRTINNVYDSLDCECFFADSGWVFGFVFVFFFLIQYGKDPEMMFSNVRYL